MRSARTTYVAAGMAFAGALALASTPAASANVAALGRLEPGDGVIDVGAARGERVARVEVVEGQDVRAGDVLVVLESEAERRAVRDAQRALVDETRLDLRRSRELAPLRIEAQEAETRRLEAELDLARLDLTRLASLRTEELVAQQAYDHQQAVVRKTEEAWAHANAELRRLRLAREIELAESEVRLRRAEAELASAEARWRLSTLLAPVAGRVLTIFLRPGESVETEPILRLGETARMYAVAEVYETDVGRVSVGQPATVRSPALGRDLRGTVERVGRIVRKNDVLDVDPAAERDARVIEVRVRLDDAELAERYVHLQVDVEIEVGAAPSP